MLHLILFLIRVPILFFWIISGIVFMSIFYPFLKRRGRTSLNRWWSGVLLRICGLRIKILGNPILKGTALWIGNHVSWKDIFIVNHIRAACFIGKSDIAKWPIIGSLVTMAGTIYIDRNNRKDVIRVSELMYEKLAQGEVVAFFPEGTTTDGFDVLQFKGGLLQIAADQEIPVQTVVCHYFYKGKRSSYAAYIGDQSLLHNIWTVLGAWGIRVEVDFMEPIVFGPKSEKTRYEIANILEVNVRRRLQERLSQENGAVKS